MKNLNLVQRIGIVGGLALALAGCASPRYQTRTEGLGYNPHALSYIEQTLDKEGVVPDPLESATADKIIRDIRQGVVKPNEVTKFLTKYADNIEHPLESAAYEKALRDLGEE